jgi:hypothetical protein
MRYPQRSKAKYATSKPEQVVTLDGNNVSTRKRVTTRLNLQLPTNYNKIEEHGKEVVVVTKEQACAINTTIQEKPIKLSPDKIQKLNLLIEPLVHLLFMKKIQLKNKRLPRHEYIKVLSEYQKHFKWISLDIIKQCAKRKYKKYKKEQERMNTNMTTDPSNTPTAMTSKGSRPPIGSTVEAKQHISTCILQAAKSEITDLYEEAIKKQKEKEGKKSKQQLF